MPASLPLNCWLSSLGQLPRTPHFGLSCCDLGNKMFPPRARMSCTNLLRFNADAHQLSAVCSHVCVLGQASFNSGCVPAEASVMLQFWKWPRCSTARSLKHSADLAVAGKHASQPGFQRSGLTRDLLQHKRQHLLLLQFVSFSQSAASN
ncbi:unnamed protein product [Effrenium voratum]|uniref:Uncharacterized protein n=1 Tax=Effrenium voratum TaxID=2562239 RepID=A0AA36J244_9DINO|nr:unnamed protein product [Effrenium voratum]